MIARRRTACESAWHLYRACSCTHNRTAPRSRRPTWQPVVLQDVVELIGDGQFLLRGRHADLVEIAGKRASLADLTRRVLALDGVEDAIVVQLDEPDRFGVQRIAALVVAPGRDTAAMLRELRDAMDAAFLPRPLRKVAAVCNETGKLPRAAVLAALTGTRRS